MIFRVFFHTFSDNNGKREFMNFDCPDHDTIASLTAALKDGIVLGDRLHSRLFRNVEPRSFQVTGRFPFPLEQSLVHSIGPLPVRLVDQNGNPFDGKDTARRKVHQPADLRAHS